MSCGEQRNSECDSVFPRFEALRGCIAAESNRRNFVGRTSDSNIRFLGRATIGRGFPPYPSSRTLFNLSSLSGRGIVNASGSPRLAHWRLDVRIIDHVGSRSPYLSFLPLVDRNLNPRDSQTAPVSTSKGSLRGPPDITQLQEENSLLLEELNSLGSRVQQLETRIELENTGSSDPVRILLREAISILPDWSRVCALAHDFAWGRVSRQEVVERVLQISQEVK